MRLRRLELLRYGHFTDAPLDFPRGAPDLHIVFGANEAGKSTALEAIGDLLFGIPARSRFAFRHAYKEMCLGAALESGDESLQFRRRKARKDEVRTPDDTEAPFPEGEAALSRLLAGADRSFFERMLSLDPRRLRDGGREILEAKDDVGQMLFAAGAGIEGLRDTLTSLETEADGLWAPRRAGHRRFYQAQEMLKKAEVAIREHQVTAAEWEKARQALSAAGKQCRDLEVDIEETSAALRKLSRIRRVYRYINREAALNQDLDALTDAVLLPTTARDTFDMARQQMAEAGARIGALTEQRDALRKERSNLHCDEALLQRDADIRALHEWRINIRTEKQDLPKRQAELDAAVQAIRGLAAEAGWPLEEADDVLSRIPPRAKVTAVRALLTERGKRLTALESARAAVEEAELDLDEQRQRLVEADTPADTTHLSAAIRNARPMTDLDVRIDTAEGALSDLDAALQSRLARLTPAVESESRLRDMPLPPRETVQQHREDAQALSGEQQACADRIRHAEQELTRQQKAYGRMTQNDKAVPFDAIEKARAHRDQGWSLIRRRFLENDAVSNDETLAFTGPDHTVEETFEDSMREADHLADRRFDNAEAAAKLAVVAEKIAAEQDRLDVLREEAIDLEAKRDAHAVEWIALWSDTPVEPASPDVMMAWFEQRDEMLDLAEKRDRTKREHERLTADAARAKAALLQSMGALERGALDETAFHSLRLAWEAATELERTHVERAKAVQQLSDHIKKAEGDCARKAATLKKAEAAWCEWAVRWKSAVDTVGLNPDDSEDSVAAQLDLIDQMREQKNKIDDLRHKRIGAIQRDITAFERDVSELLDTISPDLSRLPADEAVLALEERLREAAATRHQQNQKDNDINRLTADLEAEAADRDAARQALDGLLQAAGATEMDDLDRAIERSGRLRALRTELEGIHETLSAEGDGHPIETLRADCEDVDLDEMAAQEETTAATLNALQAELVDAKSALSEAKRAFDAIGGDDAAASAEADRQAALTELQSAAEQYVRARGAAVVLKWAIERFRQAQQAPLLRRAGRLFAILTNQSFDALQVAYDDNDHTHLVGVRPDGTQVDKGGMSTGTADQLYLALRIASVEDYLERAAPLPFIADDLFIQFDDDRAAAGLELLGELAKKTQVLFFTHHRHLLDIARATLGGDISVVELDSARRED